MGRQRHIAYESYKSRTATKGSLMDNVNRGGSSRLLIAELLVVFLGVYGAFWVDDFRDQQDRDERTRKVILALQQDLEDYVEVSGGFVDYIEKGLQNWHASRARGETPAPFVFRIFGAEVPPLTTWEAVRQAELVVLIDTNLLYELGFYYNEISGMGAQNVRYATFTESDVLPQLKMGNSSFYTEDGERLLPRFEAHMDRLDEIRRLMAETATWADCLAERLENINRTTEVCRTDVGVTML